MSRQSSSAPSRPRRVIPRWIKVSVISVLILANVAVLGTWWILRSADVAFRENTGRSEEVVRELSARPVSADEPLFMLIIGSDSREGVDRSVFGDFGGARADVVMIARFDRAGGTAQLLSIPRDTLVPIEGRGEDKVNAAYAYGGAPLMVKTVRNAFEMPIHHYVEVDFAGFQSLVDELGGVEMTFAHPARDPKSKLDVPAGQITLDGFQALAYARSRTYQELRGGSWRSVDASDIGRTQRQQALILAILRQLKRPSTLVEMGPLVASLSRHMTVDAALADASMVELAFSMRGIRGGDVDTATLPTVGASRQGASVQLPDQPAAGELLAAFRAGRSLDLGELAAISVVDVLNGNGTAGSAARWAEHLAAAGYSIRNVADAPAQQATTSILVDIRHSAAAERIVERLGFGEVFVGSMSPGVDAVVILGHDAAGE